MCNYNLRKVDKLDLKDSPNSNSTRNQVDEEPLSGCTTSKSLFIYLFIYLMNLMIQWHQGPETVLVSYSSWKIRKFKNILICTCHAKLKLIASTYA